MNNNIPYDLYALNWTSLAYHSLARFKQIVRDDNMLPPDVCEQIEDEPSDADIQAHIDSRGMF